MDNGVTESIRAGYRRLFIDVFKQARLDAQEALTLHDAPLLGDVCAFLLCDGAANMAEELDRGRDAPARLAEQIAACLAGLAGELEAAPDTPRCLAEQITRCLLGE